MKLFVFSLLIATFSLQTSFAQSHRGDGFFDQRYNERNRLPAHRVIDIPEHSNAKPSSISNAHNSERERKQIIRPNHSMSEKIERRREKRRNHLRSQRRK